MSKFYLIRHSITKGNLEKRYIGAKTDEPLCKAGYELLKEKHYPKVEKVIASPMKRCIETAQLLFPDTQIQIEESLRECDFGEFENKNYQELSQSKAYQAWISTVMEHFHFRMERVRKVLENEAQPALSVVLSNV